MVKKTTVPGHSYFSITVNTSMSFLSHFLSNHLCMFGIMCKGLFGPMSFVAKLVVKSLTNQEGGREDVTRLVPSNHKMPLEYYKFVQQKSLWRLGFRCKLFKKYGHLTTPTPAVTSLSEFWKYMITGEWRTDDSCSLLSILSSFPLFCPRHINWITLLTTCVWNF